MNLFGLNNKPKRDLHIRLTMPKGWKQLSTEQLEDVSRILVDMAKQYNLTGEYSQGKLFAEVFFKLNGLVPKGQPVVDAKEDEALKGVELFDPETIERMNTYYECEFADEAKRKQMQDVDGEIVPIRIYVWEIAELTKLLHTEVDAKGKPVLQKGGLNWLLQPSEVETFPYPTLTRSPHYPQTEEKLGKSDRKKRKTPGRRSDEKTFEGPSQWMQNFTWRQYRIACDYISYLTKYENTLARMQRDSGRYGVTRLMQVQEQVKKIRSNFMACLFNADVTHVDDETGQTVTSPYFITQQVHDNAPYFYDFPEEKFQAVLLWWQGMMHYLAKQYPKVFKKEKVSGGEADDPLKLYTRSTTTMIKYAATNEEEVNRTTYTIILQHINDMAEENERYEQMKKKH